MATGVVTALEAVLPTMEALVPQHSTEPATVTTHTVFAWSEMATAVVGAAASVCPADPVVPASPSAAESDPDAPSTASRSNVAPSPIVPLSGDVLSATTPESFMALVSGEEPLSADGPGLFASLEHAGRVRPAQQTPSVRPARTESPI
jgi:hypothetical protein